MCQYKGLGASKLIHRKSSNLAYLEFWEEIFFYRQQSERNQQEDSVTQSGIYPFISIRWSGNIFCHKELKKDVFGRRKSTGSEAFSFFICLDANKFVLLSFFSLIKRV